MGVPPHIVVHARHGDAADRGDHRRKAAQRDTSERGRRLRLSLWAAAGVWAAAMGPVAADETLRIATFTTELQARGPGLLLRDLLRRPPEGRVAAVVATVAAAAPDVLVLQGIDYDRGGAALAALADRLAEAGVRYPHRFALPPNAGAMTDHDLDGDGRTGTPRDAQGYGRFAGHGGMALLSRVPVDAGRAVDLSAVLWRDLPGGDMPGPGEGMSPKAAAVQRLSSVGHWIVPLRRAGGPTFHLLTWHATPPVFDGPEDRNGRRNRDEAALWLRYLDGSLGPDPPAGPLILAGNANLDPADGEGRRDALAALLTHPRLTDPAPRSAGGTASAATQGGVNGTHRGDPAHDTADWSDDGPGNLRVSYVLPSRDWRVVASGVLWPTDSAEAARVLGPLDSRPRHRLVWVDLTWPPATSPAAPTRAPAQ
ncbi:endonuclease/exonuclease/phosphatase family protein [Rhodobacteraceae bacterium CCMM004]|nr:endonuclease/exonuclease/phosphatase family protein [Rhodobacteraceae bacterium CCMM004]